MAFSDYHACDNCGERKTFYDADLDPEWVDGHWRYNWAKGGEGYPDFPGYRVYSLCNECEKTHEIVIRPIAQAMSAGTAKTEGLGGDSPASAVGNADAPHIMPPPVRDSGPLESGE